VVERFERSTDVCTFAVEDPIYGQAVGMAVVLDDRSGETIRALYRWLQAHLAATKMPAHWWVVDVIPRTSRGKINRDAVKTACADRPALDLTHVVGDGGYA
jgi:acyl-coenzyme A synthetase/AMP-(fatty) acid ligase